MSELVFDALLENLKDACKSVALKPFPLEEVFNAAAAGREAREGALKDLKVEGGALPYDLLTAIDVVTVATALDAARHDPNQGGEPVAAEIVDLWIRATAARALWYERFVLWPSENSTKKLEHLVETAKILGVDSIARGLLLGGQPVQFTSFVGRLSSAKVN